MEEPGLCAPAMRAERFPFERHNVANGTAGNLGWSAADYEQLLILKCHNHEL